MYVICRSPLSVFSYFSSPCAIYHVNQWAHPTARNAAGGERNEDISRQLTIEPLNNPRERERERSRIDVGGCHARPSTLVLFQSLY